MHGKCKAASRIINGIKYSVRIYDEYDGGTEKGQNLVLVTDDIHNGTSIGEKYLLIVEEDYMKENGLGHYIDEFGNPLETNE